MKLNFVQWFCIMSGAVALFLGTANPLAHIPLLIIIYPAALYILGKRSPAPFTCGWICGALGASACLYWIAVAVHDYGGIPWVLAAPCALLLGTYVGLWGGIFAKGVALSGNLPHWRTCLAAGIFWYLLEWGRSFLLTGFPWLTLSSGQAAWPVLLQILSLCGEYAYSGLLALMGILLAEAAMALNLKQIQAGVRYAAACLLCLAGILTYGTITSRELPDKGPLLRIALIQGNIRQDLKWSLPFQHESLEKYLEISRQAVASFHPQKPDLLIWPETAMPFFYQENTNFAIRLRTFAAQIAVPLLFGGPAHEYASQADNTPENTAQPETMLSNPEADLLYNRAFLINAAGRDQAYYDKEHLVPFGEYVPPGLNNRIFAKLMEGVGGFTPGRQVAPFQLTLGNGQEAKLGVLICYEAIFADLAQRRVAEGAQVLLNISNDAWYNFTSAPVQHLYLSLMRAVEQRRWLARCTNTGVTAFISPWGEIQSFAGITDGSGLFINAYLSGTVQATDSRTLFFQLKPWLPGLAFVLIILIIRPMLINSIAAKIRRRIG